MAQQQLGLVIIVDVEAALATGSLHGCTYWFDNSGPFGSTGQGTGELVSAIHGTYWSDGSQASEHVLNFLVTGVTSLPITLPRSYAEFLPLITGNAPTLNSVVRFLSGSLQDRVLLNQVGQAVTKLRKSGSTEVAQVPPMITNITGEAVENGIIFPAQYGSPDLVTGGWYWSATIATGRPRIWSYTLHIVIHRLVTEADGDAVWEPVPMTCQGWLNITNQPMRNGFTGAGVGLLPIGLLGAGQ